LPFLAWPLALLGLSALPALAAIYWLRNRYRRHEVSSLLLWEHLTRPREGGTRLQSLQTPLLFILELLALLFLVLAATGPRASVTATAAPLIVVLDDSYSMLAGGDDSPRSRAMQAIEREMDSGNYRARFVRAGDDVQLLGDAVSTADEAAAQFEHWRCTSRSGDLDAAVGFAADLGSQRGTHARILVVSDRPSSGEIAPGRVQWWSFGEARGNVAFVGAGWADAVGGSGPRRLLVEVANFADTPARPTLTIEALRDGEPAGRIAEQTLTIAPGDAARPTIPLAADAGDVRLTLSADDLAIDNALTLLKPTARTVRLRLNIHDEQLAQRIRRFASAVPNAALVTRDEDLLITDRPVPATTSPQRWSLRFDAEPDAQPYLGPFVVDLAHPLTEGVSTAGLIWAAGAERELPGRPVLTAGNITLIADEAIPDGRHELTIRLAGEMSNVHQWDIWPIMLWNLVQWRAAHLPGVATPNIRVGEAARIALEPGVETITVTDPDGERRAIAVGETQLAMMATKPGVYRIEAGEARYELAANMISAAESDLRTAAADEQGSWKDASLFQWEYRPIGWIAALIAAGLLTAHLALVARSSERGIAE